MISEAIFSRKTDEWETPGWLYEKLNRIFGFEIDVCADEKNRKCEKYFSVNEDGLKQPWEGYKVWCNPPYGKQIKRWVQKAAESVLTGTPLVVMLLPARTDTQWYHDYIAHNPRAHVVFLRGRLRFGGMTQNAPFPNMVVVFA